MYDGCSESSVVWKVAQLTAEWASVGEKDTRALPPQRLSCRYIVGGVGEADNRTWPSLEIARVFGGDGCGGSDGRSSVVGIE